MNAQPRGDVQPLIHQPCGWLLRLFLTGLFTLAFPGIAVWSQVPVPKTTVLTPTLPAPPKSIWDRAADGELRKLSAEEKLAESKPPKWDETVAFPNLEKWKKISDRGPISGRIKKPTPPMTPLERIRRYASSPTMHQPPSFRAAIGWDHASGVLSLRESKGSVATPYPYLVAVGQVDLSPVSPGKSQHSKMILGMRKDGRCQVSVLVCKDGKSPKYTRSGLVDLQVIGKKGEVLTLAAFTGKYLYVMDQVTRTLYRYVDSNHDRLPDKRDAWSAVITKRYMNWTGLRPHPSPDVLLIVDGLHPWTDIETNFKVLKESKK